MNTVTVEIKNVPQEAHALGLLLAKLVMTASKALQEGAEPVSIPTLIATLMSSDIISAIHNMNALGDEWRANKSAVGMAMLLAGYEIASKQ